MALKSFKNMLQLCDATKQFIHRTNVTSYNKTMSIIQQNNVYRTTLQLCGATKQICVVRQYLFVHRTTKQLFII
jgi:hypothetical protein